MKSMKTLMQTRSKAGLTSLVLGMAAAATVTASAAELKVPTSEYPTIQGAVNAAHPNDIIRIGAGVYTEQVEIAFKALTLIGQPGAVLRATRTLTPFAQGANAAIMEVRATEVTIQGLTFEGERLADEFFGDGALVGIYLRNSSGTVENCTFYGFRENTPGPETSSAIMAGAIADGVVHVRVAGCTFADNYVAIYCWGLSDRKYVDFNLENNTITGPEPLTNDYGAAGIQIGEGAGGRIAGNTISGHSYVGTTAAFKMSWGILGVNQAQFPPDFGVLQPLIIEGNTLRDNQQQITLVKADNSIIRNNHFQGTAPGMMPVGLGITGTNVTIANNQFQDMPEGIRLFGEDPDYGTLLGAALNVQVASNQFCNVTLKINREPTATAKETDTVSDCPLPPILSIGPAVLLSWPGEANGWMVESTTTVDGPWAAVNATLFMQDGRHVVAAPTDGTRHYFRLR